MQSYEHLQAHGHALEHEKQQLFALAEDRLRNIEELRQKEAELLNRVSDLTGQITKEKYKQIINDQRTGNKKSESNRALEKENEELQIQLQQVQEELEKYFQNNYEDNNKEENIKEENKIQIISNNEAINKVKQHLSYRLGAVMIKYGKNPLYWILMPFAFYKQISEFKQNKKLNKK